MLKEIKERQALENVMMGSKYTDRNIVFRTPSGNYIWTTNTWRYLQDIGKRAGIDGVHPHSLRHPYVKSTLKKCDFF